MATGNCAVAAHCPITMCVGAREQSSGRSQRVRRERLRRRVNKCFSLNGLVCQKSEQVVTKNSAPMEVA